MLSDLRLEFKKICDCFTIEKVQMQHLFMQVNGFLYVVVLRYTAYLDKTKGMKTVNVLRFANGRNFLSTAYTTLEY